MKEWFDELFRHLNNFHKITKITNIYFSRSNTENCNAGPDKKYPAIQVQYEYELDLDNWAIHFRYATIKNHGFGFVLTTVKETPIKPKQIKVEKKEVDIRTEIDYTKLTTAVVREVCKERNIAFALSDINEWEETPLI